MAPVHVITRTPLAANNEIGRCLMDGAIVSAASAAAAVGVYASQRVLDAVVDRVAAAVVRPCSERRAHAYFQSLILALSPEAGATGAGVAEVLDRILKPEPVSEAVFEFYRRAVLSRSRELGPRVLALLAARLVRDTKAASDVEQQIAEIAEQCTDEELGAFRIYYQSIQAGALPKHAERVKAIGSAFTVRLDQESMNEAWPSGSMRAGPLNLAQEVGSWALKFERSGAIEQIIESSSTTHRDERGAEKSISWDLYLGEACSELVRLLQLAVPN